MIKPRTKGLGRGLDALLGADAPTPQPGGPADGGAVTTLPVDRMQAGRYQPRTRMDESALQELSASIRQHGMMQPIVVRPLAPTGAAGPTRYEIIAGERRFRAARMADLSEVPVVVRDVSDQEALALALIENIQREDLNPLEQAHAIKRLIDEFHYSHEQAAEAIGRSRSATSNLLRLLNLAEPVQTMLLAGDLDMGHARALLAVDRATQIMLATLVVQKRLSVREAEKQVARHVLQNEGGGRRQPGRPGSAAGDRDIARIQEQLSDLLGTTVTVKVGARGRGQLQVDFSGPEQFDGLLQRMNLSLLKD